MKCKIKVTKHSTINQSIFIYCNNQVDSSATEFTRNLRSHQ